MGGGVRGSRARGVFARVDPRVRAMRAPGTCAGAVCGRKALGRLTSQDTYFLGAFREPEVERFASLSVSKTLKAIVGEIDRPSSPPSSKQTEAGWAPPMSLISRALVGPTRGPDAVRDARE